MNYGDVYKCDIDWLIEYNLQKSIVHVLCYVQH